MIKTMISLFITNYISQDIRVISPRLLYFTHFSKVITYPTAISKGCGKWWA